MDSSMDKILMRRKTESAEWFLKPVWNQRRLLAEHLGISDLMAQLLYNRGISEPEQARKFLQPALNDLIDPSQMSGIAVAVKRIRQAVSRGEKIVLYGDYDVDGITGVAILWRCFHLAGVDVEYYVPHRIDEGYGLNVEAIRHLAEKGAKLIITVDCGITDHQSATVAAELGMDLIVTDHHKIDVEPVRAQAVVHPDLPGQNYPNKYLCGAGVAFKLAWGLAQEFSGAQKVSDEFRDYLLSATALAALGTIADVVPLQGENRVIARFGLEALASGTDNGIRALLHASGLAGSKLQSTDIGFRLAPRLNAAGRMGHARLAVELFAKSSPVRAEEIAGYLESQNRLRQKVQKEITEQAVRQVTTLGMDHPDWRGIVLADENWHGGVIGIVASRLVEIYNRPTIIISLQADKAQGSGRSVPGFDICRALEHCRKLLLKYGGHAMAAGLNIDASKIDIFRREFNQYACDHLTEETRKKKLEIDAEVRLSELTLPALEMFAKLAPFGQGNPPVKLAARNLRLVGSPRRMGRKGDHLQLTVAPADDSLAHLQPGKVMRAVAFGKGKWEKKLKDAESFNLAFEPVINRFNGNTSVEMIVEDIQLNSCT